MTPQRALRLAAGTHAILLVNASQRIRQQFQIEIAAHRQTKLIRDLRAHR
jgi:hypothetical protein